MKKYYAIKINYLENLLSFLLTCDTSNEAIARDILDLKTYIDRLKSNFKGQDEEYTLISRIEEDYSELSSHLPFLLDVNTFYNLPLFMFCGYEADYTQVKISDTEAVSIAHDFYKLQGDFFSKKIELYLKGATNHLSFFKPNSNTEGEMLFLKSLKEAFVWVPNKNNITKVTTLIHEFEHVIDAYHNPSLFFSYVVRETSSLFMEMISSDYVEKELDLGLDGLIRRIELHNIVINDNDNLVAKLNIFDLIKKYKIKNDKELEEVLSDYDISLDYVDFLFENSIQMDFFYQISYLIAIELYQIYQVDKKRALHILQYIILHGTNGNILSILDKFNIKLNSSVLSYEKDMEKRLVLK